MDHNAAVEQMVVERYLLDELAPELRDEFEEHLFDCHECSLDLRAEALFIEEAKLQLPELTPSFERSRHIAVKPQKKRADWFAWLQPAFAVPTFAALLAVIGYQNLATIPSLRAAATQPRLVPWVSFHTGTRGDVHLSVPAERTQGAGVLIQLPQENNYTSYAFELYDPQGKRSWSHTAAAFDQTGTGMATFSLVIPGRGLQQGSYTLVTSGITPQGAQTEIDRRVLDVHFDD